MDSRGARIRKEEVLRVTVDERYTSRRRRERHRSLHYAGARPAGGAYASLPLGCRTSARQRNARRLTSAASGREIKSTRGGFRAGCQISAQLEPVLGSFFLWESFSVRLISRRES